MIPYRKNHAEPNHRVNPAAGGGLAAAWRPRSPATGYAERYAPHDHGT
jgi:hypothetical protein